MNESGEHNGISYKAGEWLRIRSRNDHKWEKSWENMTKDEKSGNRMTKKWETNWAKMVKDEKPWKILR